VLGTNHSSLNIITVYMFFKVIFIGRLSPLVVQDSDSGPTTNSSCQERLSGRPCCAHQVHGYTCYDIQVQYKAKHRACFAMLSSVLTAYHELYLCMKPDRRVASSLSYVVWFCESSSHGDKAADQLFHNNHPAIEYNSHDSAAAPQKWAAKTHAPCIRKATQISTIQRQSPTQDFGHG